jgi:hypothetical protein
MLHDVVLIDAARERSRCQLQGCGPAFSLLQQIIQRRPAQLGTPTHVQQLCRFCPQKPQMLAVQLEQLVSDAQTRERQRGRRACAHHHVEILGRIIHQELQQLHGLRSVHRLELVQEQREARVVAGASIDDGQSIERFLLSVGQ